MSSSSKVEKKSPSPSSSPSSTSANAPSVVAPAQASSACSSTPAQEDVKSRGWPKGKKRYPKMPGAPKQPLSGYVHFLNDRREDLRKECPDISFADISKKLAVEWAKLEVEAKQAYVARAEVDKERYAREFADYQKTDAYKKYIDEQEKKTRKEQEHQSQEGGAPLPKKKAKKIATKKEEEDGEASDQSTHNYGGMDFPLFTEEFLDFNKGREAELRQLRKQVAEMEEQNAVLQKHVDNMQSAISKLEAETTQQQENSAALTAHLDSLRKLVVRELQGLQLPQGWAQQQQESATGVTMDNVDELMRSVYARLEQPAAERTPEETQMLDKIRGVVAKINYDELVK